MDLRVLDMRGTMMDFPLTLEHIFDRAAKLYPTREIVSRMPDKSVHTYTYAEFATRTRQLADALQKAGMRKGDRVATLMWNHHAHLEAYFAIPIAGGVLHTLNLRLPPGDLAFIVNHAEDKFLIVDDVLLPLLDRIKADVKVEKIIVVPLTGKPVPAGMQSFEEFIAGSNGRYQKPELDERDAAGMCYTSGTTGKPKGVVYSHRALVLHSLASASADSLGVCGADAVLPVVPMFHVNAWGLPFTMTMVGAKHVYPGPHLDAESLLDLMDREKVTFAAGVPTIWMGILDALDKNAGRWRFARDVRMVVGGSAAPESMIRRFDKHNMRLVHAWGMTETTPLGTVAIVKPNLVGRTDDETYAIRAKQGIPSPLVETRAMTDSGEAAWDGKTMGELQVRGPWVAASYFKLPAEADKFTPDGWFRTGDVVTIDSEGYVKITDRTKDLIKSGGEWISSVDLENALMAHPAVKEAAVISVPHPKWAEKPLAVVVLKEGAEASPEELAVHLAPRFAKWQLPGGYAFVKEIPKTSVGKFQKTRLREQFPSWDWSG